MHTACKYMYLKDDAFEHLRTIAYRVSTIGRSVGVVYGITLVSSSSIWCDAADREGGQQGPFALGPQCKGAPKQCQTRSSETPVTLHSSVFKGLLSLYFSTEVSLHALLLHVL